MNPVTFEEILSEHKLLVYKTEGTSMRPMLRQNRDLVHIVPPAGHLKKYDVALYRRTNGQYVLHRVIKVEKDGYGIRGDNCVGTEQVPEEQVLGVLTAFQRNGKTRPVTALGYRLYVRLWCWLYPLRYAYKLARGLGGRIKQKIQGAQR